MSSSSFRSIEGWKILCRDRSRSTNSLAANLLRKGELSPWTGIMADLQTSGRGRESRKWVSLPGATAISLILPSFLPESPLAPVIIAALAVIEAIKDTSNENPGIKLINDIYIGNLKVAGILAESPCGLEKPSVIGVGANTCSKSYDLPEELENIAGTINIDRERFLKVFLSSLKKLALEVKDNGLQQPFDRWRTSLISTGKMISLNVNGTIVSGEFIEVQSDWKVVLQNGVKIEKYDLRYCSI